MKVLLIADLHYTLPQWDWLAASAGRFDLVIVAGDLLEISSIVPLEAQVIVVRKYLRRLAENVPLLVSSGNHDIFKRENDKRRSAAWLRSKLGMPYHADGDFYETGNLFFSIVPWWDTDSDREAALAQLEEQSLRARGKRWIWVYHPPPQGSPVAWDGRRDLGDAFLSDWLQRYRPWMVLGGHIHNAPYHHKGSWVDVIDGSWVFNSGRQIGSVPVFTVLEFDNNRAIWVSAEGAEKVEFVEPLEREPLA